MYKNKTLMRVQDKTGNHVEGFVLTRKFYERSAEKVALELLGKVLVVRNEHTTAGLIIETEAYLPDDEASHAVQGRRALKLLRPPGTAYVYLIYGMYYCFNIVTGKLESPESVFIRAVLPVVGKEIMVSRRKTSKHLADGPGKLCIAMGITRDYDGIDCTEDKIFIIEPVPTLIKNCEVVRTPRIGISKAVDRLLRFVL